MNKKAKQVRKKHKKAVDRVKRKVAASKTAAKGTRKTAARAPKKATA